MTEREALEASIYKWWLIAWAGGVDKGPEGCALCYLYLSGAQVGCGGCPVGNGCTGTPYQDWAKHRIIKHGASGGTGPVKCETCHQHALAELEFLRSLRDEVKS